MLEGFGQDSYSLGPTVRRRWGRGSKGRGTASLVLAGPPGGREATRGTAPWPQFLPIARDQRVADPKAAWTCAGQPWPKAAACPAAATSCT